MRGTITLLIALALATSACGPAQPRQSSISVSGTTFALLADNQLLAVSLATGMVLHSVRPGVPPEGWRGVDRLMALSPNGNQLVALVSEGKPGSDRIAFVDIPDFRIQATRLIPVSDVTYRGLAVGAQSGRIYLFGNRIAGADRGPAFGPPMDAVVTVLDPTGTEVIDSWIVRPAVGRSWFVLRGAVSRDERQLFLSYHGSDTQGMDILSIGPAGFHRCPSSQDPSSGCIRLHGDFDFYHGGFLAATGSPEIWQISSSGALQRTFNTKLEDNHLMEFVVDNSTSTMYAAGSCLYVPGLSSVGLTTGKADLLVPLRGSVCGERVLLGPTPILVILQFRLPSPTTPGALLFVDRRSGKLLRQVPTPSAPVDAIVYSS